MTTKKQIEDLRRDVAEAKQDTERAQRRQAALEAALRKAERDRAEFLRMGGDDDE